MWHVGVEKHLDAVGSLSMPSFMLHSPPKYAYGSLGLNAFSSRHSCPLRCSSDIPLLVWFWVLNATHLFTYWAPIQVQAWCRRKKTPQLRSLNVPDFERFLKALLCVQPDVHVLGRVIYTPHGEAMLHYWPYEDCVVKELGNGVIKVNATWKIAILTSLLRVERVFVLLCVWQGFSFLPFGFAWPWEWGERNHPCLQWGVGSPAPGLSLPLHKQI